MLLIDDILFFPVRGINWIFREVYKAALEEAGSEASNITAALADLYMRLEAGEITEEEFDQREAELLDRLEEVRGEEDGGPG